MGQRTHALGDVGIVRTSMLQAKTNHCHSHNDNYHNAFCKS